MDDIVNQLRKRPNEDDEMTIFSGDIMLAAAAEIERLRGHCAALVEIVRASPCPYNGRSTGVTVGECQQCGCSSGLMIKPLDVERA